MGKFTKEKRNQLLKIYLKLLADSFQRHYGDIVDVRYIIREATKLFKKSFLTATGAIVSSWAFNPNQPKREFDTNILNGFTRIDYALERAIMKVFEEYAESQEIKGSQLYETFAKLLEFEPRVVRYIKTWIYTASAAINQYERIQKATNNGIKYYKYIGPPPDREFCKIYINKILPLEEIKRLDNGQKLNALYYCGGYNCRHRWVSATEKEYKEQQNKL